MSDPIIDRLDQIKGRADKAADHVGKIAAREHRWTMTVPPRETDTDILLTRCLDADVPQMEQALRAVLDLHQRMGLYEQCWDEDCDMEARPHMETSIDEWVHADMLTGWTCEECSDMTGEELPEWPCPTVRATADALGIETEGGDQ